MTGAMYAAVAGLKAHMSKLNVIGNNIANVNTYGYKAGRTVFRSALYTTMQGGSDGTTTSGSRNPSQIGYGANIGSIDIDMSTGTYGATGKSTDCMIDGDGFFLVGDKTIESSIRGSDANSLKSLTLSRVGDFEFKADGYLTDGQGNVVYGFLCTDSTGTNVSDQLVAIRLPRMASTDQNTANGGLTAADVYASDVLFPYESTANNTTSLVEDIGADADNPNSFAQFDSITIDGKTGKISGTTKDSDKLVTIGYIAIGNVTNPNGVTQESDTYYKAGDGAGDLSISLLGGMASDLKKADGTTALDYVNSAQAGNNGSPAGMRILSAGTTELITGGLEMSTTDLATEISEMITTQRGYQANTRIITVTDSMLEELVNMKR